VRRCERCEIVCGLVAAYYLIGETGYLDGCVYLSVDFLCGF
jgi:hypothetical protein